MAKNKKMTPSRLKTLKKQRQQADAARTHFNLAKDLQNKSIKASDVLKVQTQNA